MDRLIEEFKDDLRMRRLALTTQRQYPEFVQKLSEFVNGNLINVNEKILDNYIRHLQARNLNPNTISRYFTGLSTFYDLLVYRGRISRNPVIGVRKHSLGRYKNNHQPQRYCPTIEEVRMMVSKIIHPLDLAVVVLLLKTGVRRTELSTLNLKDVDLKNKVIHLKPTGKRSNLTVFYDEEAAYALKRWLDRRQKVNINNIDALFINRFGERLSDATINSIVKKYATEVGLHHPDSKNLSEKLTAHNLRYWNTTYLRKGGMSREYVQWLRGDAISSAIDQYFSIDAEDVQKMYLNTIPQLGLL